MKTIILFILLVSANFAQNPLLTLFDSGTTTPPAASYTTDSLLYYWNYNTLTDGDIIANEWEDINAVPFTNVTSDPAKTSVGVTFDGNDDINRSCVALNGALAVDMVIKIDTTTVQGQIFSINNGDELSASFHSTRELRVYANNGTTAYTGRFHLMGLHNVYAHFVVTFDGASTPKVYYNNVQMPNYDTGAAASGMDGLVIMGYGTESLSAGTIVKLLRVYNGLSRTEIEDNYNSDSVQDEIP